MSAAPTGMHSLPTEIKQQIARCCADQDALLASALKEVRLDEDVPHNALSPRHDALRRAVAQSQSLVALSAVSRQWNDLVAPFLFEALPLEKLSSDYLPREILRRLGRHFVRLTGMWDRDDLQFARSSSYIYDLVSALPHLSNLKQLHMPDLVHLARAGRPDRIRMAATGILTDDALSNYMLRLEAHEEAILSLVQRAESIMHPEITPVDLLASFTHVSGANLKALEFSSRDDGSQQVGLASILRHFPNLESLTIYVDVFDRRGALNRILVDDPTVEPDPASQPRLRRLVLIGAYDRDRFGDKLYTGLPSSAPLMRLAQRFAETLRVLVFDIDNYTYEEDDFSLEDHVVDETEFKFDHPFPALRRLVLKGLGALFLDLLLSLNTEMLPEAESCLCDLGFDDAFRKLSGALKVAAGRLPALEVAESPSGIESMTGRLAQWLHHEIPAQPGHPTRCQPWYQPIPKPDPADQTACVQLTLEHLSEWFCTARDTQDSNALAQIQTALEGVDARRAVIDTWAGTTASKSKPESE